MNERRVEKVMVEKEVEFNVISCDFCPNDIKIESFMETDNGWIRLYRSGKGCLDMCPDCQKKSFVLANIAF